MCHSAASFDRSSSSTFKSAGTIVNLGYGTGSGKAERGWDTVALSGTGEISVKNQGILLMQGSMDFEGMQADGLLVRYRQGLGFSSLSDGEPTLVDNLKVQGAISKAVFAIYLNDIDVPSQEDTPLESVISIGGWDLAKYARTDFTWVPVYASIGHWVVRLDGVSLGSDTLSQHAQPAIVDSGTSLLIVPSTQYARILQLICLNQNCANLGFLSGIYCPNGSSGFPDLIFLIEGHKFTIPSTLYLKEMGTTCVIMIDEIQGLELWILGMVFMRGYYTVFDMEKPQIGFARSINVLEESNSIGEVLFWVAICGGMLILMGIIYLIWARKREYKAEPLLSTSGEGISIDS
jgi:hypothetical protein